MKINFTKISFLVLLVLISSRLLSQATLVGQFDFNGNLNDKYAISTVSSFNNFATNYPNGVLNFTANTSAGEGGGVVLAVPNTNINSANYSIAVDFKLSTVTGYVKIIDFNEQNNDDGIYYYDGNLDFYNNYTDNTGIGTYNANTFYTFLFTRTSDDTCRAYLIQNNNVVFDIKIEDNVGTFIPALNTSFNYVFGFFMNDYEGSPGEFADSGSIRSIRVWDGTATIADVCNSVASKTTSPANGYICTSGSATVMCSGSPDNAFTNYNFTPSSSTGTQVVLTPSATTTYSVAGDYYATGCSVPQSTFNITIDSPTISISGQATICAGQSATLNASGTDTYTWSAGGNSSTAVVSPTSNTTYTVSGTSTISSCTASNTITVQVSSCTGISEVALDKNLINLYPNPTEGRFNINLPIQANLIIINSIGKVVYTVKVDAGQTEIDLSNFANGIYFVQISDNNDKVNFKMIKQ